MLTRRPLALVLSAAMFSSLLVAPAAFVPSGMTAFANDAYKLPPENIRRVLDTPPTPSVSLSPTHTHLLLLERISLPPISDMAAPMLRLGGSRINPNTNGPHGPRRLTGLTLKKVADGADAKGVKLALPENANISSPSWSVDGKYFVFTNTHENGISLWVGDVEKGTVRQISGANVNSAGGGVRWMPDQRSVLVRFVPDGRAAMPKETPAPTGPVVQDADGKPAPVRTFQDLLTDAHDEELFDWVMTSQLAVVNIETGARTNIGAPAVFTESAPSPSGEFLLIGRLQKPYSYQVPWSLFPEQYEVWNAKNGAVVQELVKMPLRDRIPTQGVQTGPRGLEWMETQPATLLWVEALDGGDPRAKVPHRDRLMALNAPFAGEATEVMKLQHRFSGITWLEEPSGPAAVSRGMLSEFERERRWSRTWMISMTNATRTLAGEPRVVFDRSINDRYNDPGSPLTDRTKAGFPVIKVDNEHIYLRGEGATPEGDRPFFDRMSLADFKMERLWRNEGEMYETVVDVLDVPGNTDPATLKFVTSFETKTTPPNLTMRQRGSAERTAITKFTDPLPELRKIRKEIVQYTRDDGVPLSGTMYLPPDYVEGTKLPLVVWAYPNEVSDAATAGQVSGSPYRFTQIGGSSHLFMLLAGYAVMDDASMPVIGDPETMNDTFVKQIVANAKAAIDKAASMGVADPTRVAVGGHSYGAFMTANLLAHAPAGMFRAGIARSGAYNRTLTPFGFQSERRSFWEARDVYMTMSPFTYADKIKTPILMIHGQIDNNPGTFPMQSERLFQAIRGTGGMGRLVMLPFESHGYMARESIMHVLAESIEWLDKYVKNAPAESTPATTPAGAAAEPKTQGRSGE